MSLVSAVTDSVLNLHGIAAYAVVGGLAFCEAALLVGFVLPGESAVILGGVLAEQHHTSLGVTIAVAVAGAILGDSTGYELGKRVGPTLLKGRIFARHSAGLDRGFDLLRRYGGKAIFLGRFTAFLRAVLPGMAGVAGMRYRTFLPWNAAGGIVWATGFSLIGYAAGTSYTAVETWSGRVGDIVLAAVVLLALALVLRRHRRVPDKPPPLDVDGPEPPPHSVSTPSITLSRTDPS